MTDSTALAYAASCVLFVGILVALSGAVLVVVESCWRLRRWLGRGEL